MLCYERIAVITEEETVAGEALLGISICQYLRKKNTRTLEGRIRTRSLLAVRPYREGQKSNNVYISNRDGKTNAASLNEARRVV